MAERGGEQPRILNDQKDCVRQAPGMMLALDAGKDVKDLKITLTPLSVVSGTVTEETGDPIASWEVRLWQIDYGQDERRTLVGRSGAQSRADGTFRITNVPPGRYYLSAGIPPQDDGRMRASRPPRLDLVKTFYPSELDFSRSAVVDVTPGAELRGMDIRVRKAQVYSISGSLVPGPGADDAVGQDLRLFGEDGLGDLVQMGTARVQSSDNSWQFRGFAPGEYLILGGGDEGGVNPQHCIRRRVSVTDSDLKGLVFPLGDCPQLTGTIKFEDAPTEVPPSVTLTDSLTGFNRNSESNADGSFRTAHLAQSVYFIDIPGLPANAYVKSARSGSQDLVHSPLDITGASPGTLEVVVSLRGATVTATVKNDRGEPLPGVTAIVWPTVPRPGSSTAGIKTAQTDQNGNVTISGLAPGEYFAAAWDDTSVNRSLLQSTAFLSRFQSEAAGIAVVEDAKLSVVLKPVSREKIASEISKLP